MSNSKEKKIKESRITNNRTIKILLLIAIIILIICVLYIIFGKNLLNDKSDDLEKKYISSDNLYFTCSLITDEEKNDDISIYTKKGWYGPISNAYKKGDHLSCKINVNNKHRKYIDYISFGYSSSGIEIENIYSKNDITKVNITGNNSFVTLRSKENSINFDDIAINLYVKENSDADDTYKIKLINVKLHNTVTGNEYIKENNIEFDEIIARIIRSDGKLIFEKVDLDGLFNKTSEYICNDFNLCQPSYGAETFQYHNDSNNNMIIVSDYMNDKHIAVLYDMNNGIVGTYDGGPVWIYSKNDKYMHGTYMYVSNLNSDEYGIIDKNGNVIHDFNLNMSCPDIIRRDKIHCIDYSIEDDLFVDKKDDKYGIVRMTSNDVVIDYNYEYIRLINDKYFKVLEKDKWYIYSFVTKDKHLNNGFDDIKLLTDGVLIVTDNGYWRFVDFNNNDIIKEKIKIDSEYSFLSYFEKSDDENIIVIKKCNDEFCHEESSENYEYNIKKKTLVKK